VGSPVSYKIKRGQKIFEVDIKTMTFTWLDLFMTYGIPFISSLAFITIGMVVFIMKPNTYVSWTLIFSCIFLSLWSITIFDIQSTHFGFIRLYLAANGLLSAAFIHFSLFFPEPRPYLKKHAWIQFIPWLVAGIIVVPLELIYPRKGFELFYSLELLYLIVATLAFLYPVAKAYLRPSSPLARQRSKVVLLGAALAFPIPAVAYFSQLMFGSFLGIHVLTHLLTIPLILFPASMAYAIVRHNLFDVDVYIKRTMGYVIMTMIIIGAYMLVSIPLNISLSELGFVRSKAFPVIFTLIVILVFNPMYHRIQSFVDRVFFRKEYNYGEIVDKVGNAITSVLDLSQVIGTLARAFIEDMFINTSSILLLAPAGDEYCVFYSEGEKKEKVKQACIEYDAPLMEILREEKREITKYEILENPKYRSISEKSAGKFDDLCASLILPLVYKKKIIGLLCLGEKKSGKFFTREDIDLSRTLANQGAVAIENSRMVEEVIGKERMEEELAIGRDLQMSMLPAECPIIDGFEIEAYANSAMEVGGDFYDFIEMGENKSSIVIGDVTGKSVSGALVMSASRSIFRMLAEEDLSVSEIMVRANQRTKKDIKTGMFVALLYAVLDTEDRTLTLCSAGQTQPVYVSAADGKASLVETAGDTFPLGILDDVDYQETRLNMLPGDKIILYTDGIVEAMNEHEEMFGFERLLEIAQDAGSMTADALLKKIMDKVNEFAEEVAQHDDITIIVLGVKGN